ncbi:MAG: hypothetical protein CVV08_20425 [Gammaproteobacteria bacterium HGW-Gammaproteobacteria-12]|nr:MAG: hypothetical protein CVV08_20425 [Gammaproteobacteria bacterium HGW-Gammaproteobacteria-12]
MGLELVQSLLRVGTAALKTGSDAHLQLVNSASSPVFALHCSSSRDFAQVLTRGFTAPLFRSIEKLSDRSGWADYSNLWTWLKTIYFKIVHKK